MQNKLQCWLVGGYVRDLMLDKPSKDLDYVMEASFEEMRNHLLGLEMEILHEKPEFLTMRVRRKDGVVVDFACCRSEMDYDGRRPGTVLRTDLLTDLSRRDFTINAMAMAVDSDFQTTGEIVDPFGGQQDLRELNLRFVGKAKERLAEDGLRWLRAIRFCITKGFDLDIRETQDAIMEPPCNILDKVSVERIREELYRCFKCDTRRTLKFLYQIPDY